MSLSAGFSSLERFIVQASIHQRNFRGKGQAWHAGVDYQPYARAGEPGLVEPYLLDKNIAISGDIFRREYTLFADLDDRRLTTYSQVLTDLQIRTRVPLTEYRTLSDRYDLDGDYLAGRQFRGVDICGVRPCVQSILHVGFPDANKWALVTDHNRIVDEGLGGRAYYLARAELEIPLDTGARELGLRPSIFNEGSSLFGVSKPLLEQIVDDVRPRLSAGAGVNWNSPYGPFRIDIAYTILREKRGLSEESSSTVHVIST